EGFAHRLEPRREILLARLDSNTLAGQNVVAGLLIPIRGHCGALLSGRVAAVLEVKAGEALGGELQHAVGERRYTHVLAAELLEHNEPTFGEQLREHAGRG